MNPLIFIAFCLPLTWADLIAPEPGQENDLIIPGPLVNETDIGSRETGKIVACLSGISTAICKHSGAGNPNILCVDLIIPQYGIIAILVCGCRDGSPGTGDSAVLVPGRKDDCVIAILDSGVAAQVYCALQCYFCNERPLLCAFSLVTVCVCFCGDPLLSTPDPLPALE